MTYKPPMVKRSPNFNLFDVEIFSFCVIQRAKMTMAKSNAELIDSAPATIDGLSRHVPGSMRFQPLLTGRQANR